MYPAFSGHRLIKETLHNGPKVRRTKDTARLAVPPLRINIASPNLFLAPHQVTVCLPMVRALDVGEQGQPHAAPLLSSVLDPVLRAADVEFLVAKTLFGVIFEPFLAVAAATIAVCVDLHYVVARVDAVLAVDAAGLGVETHSEDSEMFGVPSHEMGLRAVV